MPRSPHLINRVNPTATPEAFDVEVTLAGDSTASIKGDSLAALFDRLGEWGPGAANASFDLDLEGSILRECKVMQYATGHVMLVRFATREVRAS